ncbi:MAG: CapA family protein [Pseudomonadota bacterium]
MRYSFAVGIVTLISACASTPSVQPVAPDAPPPVSQVTEDDGLIGPPAPAGITADPRATQVLSIAAVGDMMLGTDFPDPRLADDDGAGLLAAVTPWLRAADIAFGNIEGVLMDGGEPAKRCSNPRACYLFRSPARYAQWYADAGFDVVSFANNHARDFGEEGRTASMQHVAALGMHHSGRVGDIARWQQDGLSFALIAFAVTRNSNSMLEIVPAAREVALLAAEHDIVLVSFHGGAEGLGALRLPFDEEIYYNEPRGNVVAFARAMVDAGADLVLGHGPHVVRAMERYRDRLIAYSLGNFATYFGISVAGLKGIAPVLSVRINGFGEFIDGRIYSTRQPRPQGPQLDPSQTALRVIRALSVADFGDSGITFDDDGYLHEAPRRFVRSERGARF